MTSHIIDTDVFIDYLRGLKAATSFIDSFSGQPATSAIVVAELYSGVRDGAEMHQLRQLLAFTKIVPVSNEIAVEAGMLRRQFAKSHSLALPDALIAATAKLEQATLVTLNKKHFPMLTNLLVPYSRS